MLYLFLIWRGGKIDLKTKELFITHTKISDYKRKVAETRKELEKLFTFYHKPSVSVSGGKDSLVLLHLAQKIKSDILVWHWDYGIFMPRHLEKEVQTILTTSFNLKIGKNLFIDRRYSKNQDSTIGYKAFFSALKKHITQHSIDLCLIGLRREESNKRKIRARKLLEKSSFEKVTNAFPIREWTWLDIWAYIGYI